MTEYFDQLIHHMNPTPIQQRRFIDGLKMEAGLREIIESADAIILNQGTIEELLDKTEETLLTFNLN